MKDHSILPKTDQISNSSSGLWFITLILNLSSGSTLGFDLVS